MKKVILLALCACILPAVSYAEPAKREAVLEFMESANFDKVSADAIEMAVNIVKNSNPEMAKHEDKLRAFYEKYIGPDAVREEMIQIYAETFTTEELLALAAHNRTPAGKKALKMLPQLMQKGSELGRMKVMNHIGELQVMISE